MKPISEFPLKDRDRIRGVFADIDDTLTSDGRLTGAAYRALERLFEVGFLVVPITGRPAGWCDHIARMWPVDAVVGENGAFYFRYDRDKKKLEKRFLKSDFQREADRQRLDALKTKILAAVPGAGVASDQLYREADLAIDFCEDVPRLSDDDIAKIVALFEVEGATAKVSSIHVNGWFGDYDKLSMTRTMLSEAFSIDLEDEKDRFVFVGDSPNDAPMFGFFPNAVAVANVNDFGAQMDVRPTYVTRQRAGAGFVEVAEFLLAGDI